MAQKKAHEVECFLTHFSRSFPVVLVYGPDRGLVCERVQCFIKLTQIAVDDPFSTVRLDASEIEKDPARLSNEVRTLSLFGNDRLVWISNAANQKTLIAELKSLMTDIPERSFILIEAGDLKKGTGLRNIIETAPVAMALPCYSDDIRSLDALIDDVLDDFKMTLSLEARKMLRENLGGDRLVSRSELEKLCLYASEKGHIVLEDVKKVVSNVSAFSYDEVIDAILLGDVVGFDAHFRRAAMQDAVFFVLTAAQRHFQQLQLLRYQVEIEKKQFLKLFLKHDHQYFFSAKKRSKKALKYWELEQISHAMVKIQDAILESRQNSLLGEAIVGQILLELTAMVQHRLPS
ncbi:DNA polymerase III subunit delta [Bartonella ancashensis]|uniref:DNA polymerase III subunit delta n=1 Tax=Bartonella ancashensis TaxID=1318743 RepID=A0A0M4M2S6_9HYPH|nr:DNA polymerase III subunit delta [Bartonella ancashensis]ALE03224.1 DNA polymerase III delta subunit [Bartonella ancashensis]